MAHNTNIYDDDDDDDDTNNKKNIIYIYNIYTYKIANIDIHICIYDAIQYEKNCRKKERTGIV
jgi:hypothetical protein